MNTRNSLIAKLRSVAIAVPMIGMQVSGVYAQAVIRTTSLSPTYLPGSPLGTWSGNSLVALESYSSGEPILRIYDQSGAEIQRVAVQVPGSQLTNILGNRFARSTDGYVAVSGSAYGAGDRGAIFLAVISPDGASQLIVRTDPYIPHALVFASDGTLWVAGNDRDERETAKEVSQDYFLVRRFDKKGRLLGGVVPRTLFPPRHSDFVTSSYLVSSKDRVGWFSPRANQYMEFSLDGKALATYQLSLRPDIVSGVALCDDNTLWVSVQAEDARQQSTLTSLDRVRGVLSGGNRQPFIHLYGCSGTTLVATSATSPARSAVDWIATR
jgi:hypothetical protein